MAAMGGNFRRQDAAGEGQNAPSLLGDRTPPQQTMGDSMDIDRNSASDQNKALEEARAYLRKLDAKLRKSAEDALAVAEAGTSEQGSQDTTRSSSGFSPGLTISATRSPKPKETRTTSDASSTTSLGRDMSIKSLLNPPNQSKDVAP